MSQKLAPLAMLRTRSALATGVAVQRDVMFWKVSIPDAEGDRRTADTAIGGTNRWLHGLDWYGFKPTMASSYLLSNTICCVTWNDCAAY